MLEGASVVSDAAVLCLTPRACSKGKSAVVSDAWTGVLSQDYASWDEGYLGRVAFPERRTNKLYSRQRSGLPRANSELG